MCTDLCLFELHDKSVGVHCARASLCGQKFASDPMSLIHYLSGLQLQLPASCRTWTGKQLAPRLSDCVRSRVGLDYLPSLLGLLCFLKRRCAVVKRNYTFQKNVLELTFCNACNCTPLVLQTPVWLCRVGQIVSSSINICHFAITWRIFVCDVLSLSHSRVNPWHIALLKTCCH